MQDSTDKICRQDMLCITRGEGESQKRIWVHLLSAPLHGTDSSVLWAGSICAYKGNSCVNILRSYEEQGGKVCLE